MVEAEVADSEEEDREDIKLSPSFMPKIHMCVNYSGGLLSKRRSWVTPLPRKGGSMNIYVGNLSLDVTEEELRQVFIIFGEVTSVILMDDKYIGSGQPRGYGYVQMPSKSEGQAAVIGLQEKSLRGQLIKVVEALPLSDNGHNKPIHSKKGRHFNVKTRQR
jgi:RNA recognition motif-containing protein